MSGLPITDHPLVVRTDFTNEAAWRSICEAIVRPATDDEFVANVSFVDDRAFDGLSVDDLFPRLAHTVHRIMFVVDSPSLTDPEHPILAVSLDREPGRSFRVIPSEMWAVENNVSNDGIDFEEFADAVDENGVFRGFA